ncbi:hypothetical protein RFI_09822 [Reticulomyxa filosa]|uniref:Uncharacterized protein n=1 Tax=Reticulomyxa filosa TaxID=46433 RepID=X6NM00_RETFI|nr:hypothetical protein RFI_09822 [Reticulomyxa filosa]|eukprot:ETO27310.1 hypothetical protein RFI_09822 [Reticulomyxa filosa]
MAALRRDLAQVTSQKQSLETLNNTQCKKIQLLQEKLDNVKTSETPRLSQEFNRAPILGENVIQSVIPCLGKDNSKISPKSISNIQENLNKQDPKFEFRILNSQLQTYKNEKIELQKLCDETERKLKQSEQQKFIIIAFN